LESDNLWGIKYEIMNEIYEIIENVVILFLVIECWGFRVKLNRLEKKLK